MVPSLEMLALASIIRNGLTVTSEHDRIKIIRLKIAVRTIEKWLSIKRTRNRFDHFMKGHGFGKSAFWKGVWYISYTRLGSYYYFRLSSNFQLLCYEGMLEDGNKLPEDAVKAQYLRLLSVIR